MPNSSPVSLPQLRSNRSVKVMLCVLLFCPILWIVYSRVFFRVPRSGSDRGPIFNQNASPTTPGHSAKPNHSGVISTNSPGTVQGTTSSGSAGVKNMAMGSLGNFEPPDEPPRSGPGEGGKPHMLRPDQDFVSKISVSKYGMSMVCSDEISLDRTIPDLRHAECKHHNYSRTLPNASVVIVFHNEGLSALMRTVHSVINRTPPHILAEVLLVDDYSERIDLKDELEAHIRKWNGTVRLIRNEKREGLINTRSRGAREARGEVIVFLDGHCEVNKNWLPPLLTPIHRDRKTLTVPVIDGIDSSTFEVVPVYRDGHLFKGIFEWGMFYKEKELSLQEINGRSYLTEPYKSPTYAGGLFAINRNYFLELGAYDPGLRVWGGENFELSFKVWLCGGSILWVPCSRVAHVYKSSMSFSYGALKKTDRPVVTINYKRVVETWMDDKHKEYFYRREPLARLLGMGDIEKQLKLKEELHCKSFQWFMDNVATDLTSVFPEPPPNLHWGQMQSVGSKYCLDTMGRDAPAIIAILICSSGINTDQIVRLNTQGQLGIGERCVDADKRGVYLKHCELGSVNGPWRYNETTNVMYHKVENKCMTIIPGIWRLLLMVCDPVDPHQQWKFSEVRP